MRARQLLLSVTTALILIALPVVPLGAQPKEVVIGLLYPLSGPAASAGVDEKHAFELFADMVIRVAVTKTEIKAADLLVPWAGVKFDETGQNTGVRAIIVQLQGGRYWTVWPFDVAARDVIYPIPRWSERK
jgi:hypothetical protein